MYMHRGGKVDGELNVFVVNGFLGIYGITASLSCVNDAVKSPRLPWIS